MPRGKKATVTIPEREATDPSTILKGMTGNFSEDGIGGDNNSLVPNVKIEIDRSPAIVEINGFETQVARDLYFNLGDEDVAQKAEELCYIIGEPLFEKAQVAAKCSGLKDVSKWLSFRIWQELEQLEDPVGDVVEMIKALPEDCREERTKEDNDASKELNRLIAQHLGKSNLGRVVTPAKTAGVSNRCAIQAVVVAHLTDLYRNRKL